MLIQKSYVCCLTRPKAELDNPTSDVHAFDTSIEQRSICFYELVRKSC